MYKSQAEHNTRTGRRSRVCGGTKSFLQAFNESYAEAPIRKARPEQRRLWLLAAEGVRADKARGAITLMGNVFWSEALLAHRGDKLIVRFDPQNLLADLHVYRLDDSYIGAVPVYEAAGFDNVDAARQHNRERNSWLKAKRLQQEIERKWSVGQVAALLPRTEEPEPVEARVVRPMFNVNGNAAMKVVPQAEVEQREDAFFSAFRGGLTVVGGTDN